MDHLVPMYATPAITHMPIQSGDEDSSLRYAWRNRCARRRSPDSIVPAGGRSAESAAHPHRNTRQLTIPLRVPRKPCESQEPPGLHQSFTKHDSQGGGRKGRIDAWGRRERVAWVKAGI